MRAFFAVILAAAAATAQSLVTARAGLIYMVEGPATVDGQLVRIQNRTIPPQVEHGQVVSSPHGHAELLMGQDAVLWTGTDAQVRLDDSNVDAPRVSLLAGSAMLEVKNTRAERHIFIDLGNQTAQIATAGLYRFDRSPERVRAWSGAATLQGPPGTLNAGQMSQDGRRENFDRHEMDELHYFAAYRSLVLEDEGGHLQRWSSTNNGDYRHPGFDLALPLPPGAARAKYLAASEAGLVNYIEPGNANRRPPNVPIRAGRNLLETNNDRAEVFLGLGMTARLNDHTRLRILDTTASTPDVLLESGEVIVEVAKAAKNVYLSFRMGASVTQLHKPGLYRFQEASSSLFVYSGESLTYFGDLPVRATRGQHLEIDAPKATRFDAGQPDPFFQWNGRRSLELYASDSSFMPDWEPQASPGRIKHKVFGEQSSLSGGNPGQRRNLPPTPRPLTQAIPPISQDPRGNEPGSTQIK